MLYRPFSDGPLRTMLLDSDYQIKPGKWQMDFGNYLLVGLEYPVFEYFVLENDEQVVDRPNIGSASSTNNSRVKSVSCRVETKNILSLKIDHGISSLIPTSDELKMLNDSLNDFLFRIKKSYMYGIFTLTRVITASEDMFGNTVTWYMRGKEILQDIRLHRERRIKKILEDGQDF